MGNKLINLHSLFGTTEYKSGISPSSTSAPTVIYKDMSRKSKDNGELTSVVNVKAVKGAVRNLLAFYPGQRILDPEFGNTLRRYLYEKITRSDNEKIAGAIREMFERYEPRVVIDSISNVGTDEETDNNTVHLELHYHIKGIPNEMLNEDLIYSVS